ncbi:MAG: MarR family transcriptional regulator [Desulfatibacillum sp.]|nr:MarR family transcriptional regulator [Desulfatibacillum sp.]
MKVKNCVFFQLTKAAQTGAGFWANRIAHLNVTPSQAMVLNALREEDRIPSHVLGEKLRITSATTTGILDRLEKMDMVERAPHPDDRRAILVCLTKEGKQIANKLETLLEEANQDFLGSLSKEEESFFRALLKKLIN